MQHPHALPPFEYGGVPLDLSVDLHSAQVLTNGASFSKDMGVFLPDVCSMLVLIIVMLFKYCKCMLHSGLFSVPCLLEPPKCHIRQQIILSINRYDAIKSNSSYMSLKACLFCESHSPVHGTCRAIWQASAHLQHLPKLKLF